MKRYLTAALLLLITLPRPVNTSFVPLHEDLEGSGYDLQTSGSGSGDWSEEGGKINMEDHASSKDVRILGADTVSDNPLWPTGQGTSEFVVTNSKSFMENKDIFAAVIAGGVTGVTLAAAVAAVLIYRWQLKDDGGYILGQRNAS